MICFEQFWVEFSICCEQSWVEFSACFFDTIMVVFVKGWGGGGDPIEKWTPGGTQGKGPQPPLGKGVKEPPLGKGVNDQKAGFKQSPDIFAKPCSSPRVGNPFWTFP